MYDMWCLTCLALLTSPLMYACQDAPSEQELELMLQDAAAEVLAQHSYSPPTFQTPENFMRAFRPGTGLGNREELTIKGISSRPMYSEPDFSSFLYKRFNNTDYLVGVSSSNVILIKINTALRDDYLVLTMDDALFRLQDSSVSLKDVELFTRFVNHTEVLFVAILMETMKNTMISVHEVIGDRGMQAALIELNIHPATSSKSVIKISYVQSSLRGSLVILVNTLDEIKLSYERQQMTGEFNSYIEVNYPSAVDLVTFAVQGHGYIAVANEQFCDIFKLDEHVQSHVPFYRIGPLTNIADLEYFRVGFHHFLGVADANSQKLYSWNRGEFSLKQEIRVPGVLQIYASFLESCRDEVILLFIKKTGHVDLYTFFGDKELFKRVNTAIPEDFLVNPGSVTSFSYRNIVNVIFMSTRREALSFVIETSFKPLKDALLTEAERVSDVMKEIKGILENQTTEIERIKQILTSAVRSNGNQHISGVQHIHDISSTTGVVVETVNEFVLQWENSELTLEDYRQGAKDLEADIKNLENLVKDIETAIQDVVREDEYAVITGHKTFTGHVLADTLMSTSINIEKVADMNLAQIQKDVYRLNKPQQINGTLTFTEPLTINGNLDVGSTVNGIDISEEVMTISGSQQSNAQMVFMNKLVIDGNLDLSGKINGIDISEEVITLNGNHHVGSMEFLNGIQADNVQTILLDGVHMDDIYQRAMTISGKQTITADSTFSAIATGNIVLKGRLNGFDVRELAENIVRIDKQSTITGYKSFANDVTIDGRLAVKGTVNGLKIPDDLFLTDTNQTVKGRKEFLGHVIASSINVLGKIDGVSIPGDIVTLSANEEISSTLYFDDGIVAQQNIIVEGLVDGVDISEVAKEALKLNETNKFAHAIFMGPVTITGDLIVNGLVNKVNLKALVNDIIYKDEMPIEINSRKKFSKVVAEKVKLDYSINGYNIEVDFMRVNGDQVIKGTKIFTQEVKFTSVYIDDGMIGDLNVTDLYKKRFILAIDLDSEIDNEVEFVDKVIVNGNLQVLGTINGLNIPTDVVLKNSNKDISNKYFAGKTVVDNLLVDGNIIIDTFGGRNLTEFYDDRITLSTEQKIPGDIWISDSTADKISISGLVNGIDIKDFAMNVMSKTKPQTVTAEKEFSGNVFVHGPITSEGVNGVNLSDIKRRAFKLFEDNIITAPFEFEEQVSIKNLMVSGNINGVDIKRLTEDSLKKSGLQHIDGDVVFNSGFHVLGDILATNVNGLVIPEDVLLKSLPQEIRGQFTFGNVGVGGDLSIDLSINGLDLSEIAPKLARIDSETVIKSNITFTKPVHVLDNIEVTGKVNEVNLKKLFDTILRKTGDQTITGKKVFRGNVTVTGDIAVESINGINWKEFLADVVWINIPQNISSSKTFNGDIFVEKDVFVSGLANANLINGIDLQRFIDEAVYIDVPANITGPIVFKNPVEITGDLNAELINGLSLKTDIITIICNDDGRPQVITGQKTFQKLTVYGDVYADKVNSYNLQELYEDTLLTEGNQTVNGMKFIKGDVTFAKNVYPDTVNGMILSRDLVTRDTEQRIEGPVTFKGDVFVEKDLFINGLLNGVDLQNLSRDAVYLDTNQVIEGSYSFQNAVVPTNVEVSGEVDGIDLKDFDKKVTEFFINTTDSLGFIERYTRDHCDIVKYLQETLQNTYYALDSFAVYQDLESSASFIQMRSERDISLLYLDDVATMAISVQNIWDISNKKFHVGNFSTTYVAKSVSYSIGSIEMVINIGINSKDSSVMIQNSPTNIQSGFTDASVVVKKQEALVSLLFPAKGSCETHIIKEYSENQLAELHSSIVVGKEATSIALFEISDVLYLAVASSDAAHYTRAFSKIYTRVNGDWQRLQIIPISSSLVTHLLYQGYHYLAFASNTPVSHTKEPKSIQIYRNSGPNEVFSLFQKVSFDDVKGINVFRFGDLSQLHLVAWNETRIQIFGLEGEAGMRNFFTIHGTCIKDVKPLMMDNDVYLLVGQQDLKTSRPVRSVLYKGQTKGYKYEAKDLKYC